jgi:hypothetical protein
VQTLLVSVALLGLAIAFSSPTSVLAVYVLLGMPSGVRRSIAFVGGWILTIVLIGAIVVVFPSVDFHSSRTTPSRAASIGEMLVGALLVVGAVVLHRRPATEEPKDPVPEWLVRVVGRHWAVALVAGGVMLTYSVTLVAMLEILKADVSALDRVVAVAVFALTSIVTITAPITYAALAPARAEAGLERSRRWLIAHSQTIAAALLALIGVAIMLKAAYDLVA